MLRLIVRRLFTAIPLLLAVSFVTFFLLFHSPGSYVSALKIDPKIPQATLDELIKRLGLDRPFYEVWARWVWGVVTRFDFGHSFPNKVPVLDHIGVRVNATLLLALTSTLFAWILALPLGIAAAIKQNGVIDRVASAIAFIGLSVPAVLLALLAVFFAARTGILPPGSMTSDNYASMTSRWDRMKDIAWHLILPTVVLGLGGLAIYTRQMRSNLLETLKTDYMRTAMSKGLPYWKAVVKHAVRNAVNPLITLFGFAFSDLLSGAFLVENVMAWPGLGLTTIEAYNEKDMFVVATSVIIATTMLIVGNLLADILLALNDPRIRYD